MLSLIDRLDNCAKEIVEQNFSFLAILCVHLALRSWREMYSYSPVLKYDKVGLIIDFRFNRDFSARI